MLWKEGEKVHFKRLYSMNFHIYCEMSTFASASASFLLGGYWRVVMGRGSIGFGGFNSVKFEKGTVVGYGTY